MDAEYLQSTLGELLAEGLADTVLANPQDKVEYLAKWLRKAVEQKTVVAEQRKREEELLRADELAASAQKVEEEKQAASHASKHTSDSEREAQFHTLLESATSVDALLPSFLQFLRDFTHASSAYIGRVHTDKESETKSLQYVAATPDNEWLLEKRLEQRKGKVTFSIFEQQDEEEEEQPEEEDENGNPIPRAPKEKDPPSVFVPNVLLGPKSAGLHFWKLPQLGSYVAVRIKYPACVVDEVLDEAVEREAEILEMKREQDEAAEQARREAEEEARREAGEDEEEEEGEDDEEAEEDDEDADGSESGTSRRRRRRNKKEEEENKEEEEEESEEEQEARLKAEEEKRLHEEEEFILSQVQRPPAEFALCLDTLGQNRRFSEEELALITKYAKALNKKLAELDRLTFTSERKRRQEFVEFQKEVVGGGDSEEGAGSGSIKSDEERADDLDRIAEELESAAQPATKEDVEFKYRTELLLQHLKQQIAEYREYEVFPRGNLVVLQAVLFLLGYEKKQVVDSEDRPDWKRMRPLFTDDFFGRLRDFDPRATSHDSVPVDQRYTQSVAVNKLIGEMAPEEIKERNYVLSELLQWAKAVLAVKRRAKIERQQAKRDEERKKAAAERAAREEEERKREEEEEAARIAAGGEPNEEGEDDEEEEEED